MSQAGLCIMARDTSDDSVPDLNIATQGVIARACSLTRNFKRTLPEGVL
jgi:hypothetical protein